MRGWWQDLTDLVLPAECGGCGTPRTVLCDECRAALSGPVPRRVRPVPEPPGLPAVYAAAPYADEVRAALLAHKERGALTLAGALGTALAGAVRAGLRDGRTVRIVASYGGTAGGAGGSGPVLILPVPSAPWAVRARGHDPVRRIALAAAAELRRAGVSARVAPVLRQRRAVADQSGLNARQRFANLAGALEVTAGGARLLAGGRVVLVDDLVTTGATLAEAARAVREAAGAEGAGEATKAVYRRAAWEGREERKAEPAEERAKWARNVPGMAEVNGLAGPIRAAVVAAAPDSFEMNRN
ncbi:MAG: ComF family protein [Streptomyces sp.]|uniref:ComF family protein n=1 Tax=Streptomyces sp. TaxID=1931 RepID=UPI0025F21427|nr:ComF family protein [Streptomyces sp.]MBW8792182.1 ComF family protein [Streptomyces sp.]